MDDACLLDCICCLARISVIDIYLKSYMYFRPAPYPSHCSNIAAQNVMLLDHLNDAVYNAVWRIVYMIRPKHQLLGMSTIVHQPCPS